MEMENEVTISTHNGSQVARKPTESPSVARTTEKESFEPL